MAITSKDLAQVAAVGVAAGLLYFSGLAPGAVIEGDSGEIISVIHGFGIMHSPGFPGYVVLARLFHNLTWFLDVAVAVNAFSAVCAALCLVMITAFGKKIGLGHWSILPALFLATNLEFWYAAQMAEVYSLSLLTMVAALYHVTFCTPKNGEDWRPGSLALLGGLIGFGLCVHVYFWALLPTLLMMVVWFKPRRPDINQSLIFVGTLLLGLSPFLYIPFRAGEFLYVNEGGINSLSRFIDHVTWNLQRERFSPDQAIDLGHWIGVKLRQLGYFAGEVWRNWHMNLVFAVFLAVFALRGANSTSPTRPTERGLRIALLYFIILITMVFTDREFRLNDLGESSVHLLTVYLLITLLAAFAIRDWLNLPRPSHLVRIATLGSFALAILTWGAIQAPTMNLSANRIAEDHAADLLFNLPKDSILIGDNDNDLMPTVYLAAVREIRRDVAILNMSNGSQWYYENLKALYPHLRWPTYSKRYLLSLLRAEIESGREVYATNFFAATKLLEYLGSAANLEIVPRIGVFQLIPSSKAPAPATVNSEASPLNLHPEKYPFRLRGREVDVIAQRADYFLRRAQYFLRNKLPNAAARERANGLAYPQLGETEFSALIRRDLEQLDIAGH